jgi:ElaB/YqjD/DUF883 family membrane-anchored ribosome-binding protein
MHAQSESEVVTEMAKDQSLPDTVAEKANAVLASATAAVQGVKGSATDLLASATDTAGSLADRANGTKDLLAAKVADGKSTLSDTTSKLADRVSDTRDKLADATSQLADRVNETGGTLQGQAQTGLRIVRENPLGLVLSGLAVGFLAGVLAPVTDVEREKIAPFRDEIVVRAQRAADDVVQHGRGILQETAAAATAAASKHAQALAEDLQNDLGTVKMADGDRAEAAPQAATHD